MTILEKAIRLCAVAHEGQIRKDGPPYIIHPFAVALKLAQHGFDELTIAGALVHDVLEDTKVTEEELREVLGDKVLELVQFVTYDETLSWEDQRKKYINTLRNAPESAKAISVADKIHNAESLLTAYIERGPEIWKSFNRGREAKLWFEEEMLKMLTETWSHPLVEEYKKLVLQMQKLES